MHHAARRPIPRLGRLGGVADFDQLAIELDDFRVEFRALAEQFSVTP
jgi:hypothetical protein